MSSSGAMKAATGSSDEAEAALLGDADDVQKKSAESESVPVEAEIEAKTNDDDDEKATPKKAADHQSDGPDSMAAVFDNPFYRLASMFMDPDLERSIRRVVLGVFLLTLVVMFGVGIAIIFQGEKWNNKWPSLATCGCLTAGSIYVWLLTLGISKSGENTVLDIYAVTVTMLALVGMLLAPVVVSLTITLVWKIFDEDDTSGISAAFWKWNFFFWFLSTSVAYASCISILKFAPRKIVLLADISAVMALFLIWLALTVESKNGIPVMIILAVIAAISTLAAVQIHRTNNKQNGDMPQTGTDTQDVPNDEPDDKEPASEEDDGSLLSQWTSRKATTKLSNTIDYLLLYLAPLMILFMAGIVSTLVEDCKWPILATCAALGIGSMFLKTLSVAVTKTVPKWMILLELFSLLVILPIAVGFTIGGIWYIQYHGFHFGSAAKAITTLWSYLALATYIALTCTFSNTFAKVQIVTYLSVGMTFVLGEIAILAKTTDGWVVLLLFLILDGLLIAYWKMNSQARREAHVPQDGQEMPFLAMRLNGKVNVVAEYIFLLMPLLTMFVSGIVSAFVEDCKRPILATCDSLLVGSVTIWILSRNLLYQSRNQGVTLSSVSAIGMISAVVAACLSITFSWNAHNDSEVALRKDILQPLGKSAISFWIISAATVFAGRLSLYKDTSAELRSVAYCSTVMTLFLLWISIIVETMVGWAFGVWFCVHAIISTVAVISKNGIQIQNTDEAVDEEAVGQDTETTFFVSAVFRRKNPDQQAIVNKVWRAGVLFFLLTQLIVFLAGVVTIIIDDWDGRWYTLGTCGTLTVCSFFILLLVSGVMRGTGRHFCVLTTIATVGALLTTPVATALAIATIWGIHHDDEHDVSEALRDPLGKACISFWLLSAASLVVCLLSFFRKAPTRLSLYAGVSVLMTLSLCWLGIISESTNGKVVLIIFALVDVVVVIAVLSFHMEAKEFERRPDHNESSATQLESADKTKVEVIARLLFFWTPLGTLFLAGILSTLVENSKWPLLATCAAVLLGSFAMFILSKGYHPGSSWDRLTLTSISVVGMVVTLFAVPLTITAAWQLHNDKIDSVLEKLGKSSISLWLLTAATSYICLMSSLKGVAREIRLYAGISVILGLFNSWLTVMAESIEGVPVNILFFIAFLALTARVFCLHRRPTSTPRTPSSQVTHTEEEDNWKFKLEKSTISIFHYTPVVTLFIAGVISNFVEDCAKPVVTTCATLIGASIANFGHSRALQGTATTDRVLIVSAVVGILVITPLTVALTLTYIWERHSVDEVARLPLGRASITFWLLTFAAVYIGLLHSSIKHAQRMLMLLVDVCVVMTVFLIFLGVMVESSNGLVVDIMLGVLTGILTIVTIVNQNAGDTELASKDPPDTEVGTEREGTQVKKELSDSEDGDFLKGRLTKLGGRSELRKKATTIFMATPFLVLFIAGLISTCVENCKLPLLATCCILVVGAGYIVALTVGYLRGSGIYQLVLTIICLIGMAFIPIAVVLTIVLIWRVHNNQKGEFGDEFWTVLADQEPEHIAMAVAKTAATCWIVASIALYVSCLSYFEKAPRKLLYLAYSCGTMTFLLLWLGAISESDYGVFVAACFLIVTFLITLAVPVVHLRRGGLCSEACGGVDQNAVSTREKLRNNTESWKPANASPAVVASKPKLEEKSPETSSNAKARPIAHGAVVRPQDHNPSPSPVTDEKFSSGPIEKTKVEPGGWGKVLSPFLFDAFQGDFNPEPDEQDNVVEQDSSDSNKGLDSDLEVSLLEAQAIASPGATTNLTQNAGTTVKTDSDGSSKEKGPAPVKQVAATNLPKIAPPKAAVELTFVNANTNPAMAKAELYLESTRFGPLGHKDPPLTVSTFPGHRWFIVVDGSFVRMYVVEEGEKQVCTI